MSPVWCDLRLWSVEPTLQNMMCLDQKCEIQNIPEVLTVTATAFSAISEKELTRWPACFFCLRTSQITLLLFSKKKKKKWLHCNNWSCCDYFFGLLSSWTAFTHFGIVSVPRCSFYCTKGLEVSRKKNKQTSSALMNATCITSWSSQGLLKECSDTESQEPSVSSDSSKQDSPCSGPHTHTRPLHDPSSTGSLKTNWKHQSSIARLILIESESQHTEPGEQRFFLLETAWIDPNRTRQAIRNWQSPKKKEVAVHRVVQRNHPIFCLFFLFFKRKWKKGVKSCSSDFWFILPSNYNLVTMFISTNTSEQK